MITSANTRRLALIVLVAVAARALALGNPIVQVDEQFYFSVAHAMWSGAVPFVDLWDRKPVGLFLLFMPAALLPGMAGVWAYQLMALAAAVATAWIVARFADLAKWQKGAIWAAIAYILWLNLLGGVGGQSPVFYNLLMACAALLASRPRADGHAWRRGMWAMLLIGLALQVKYSVVFEGIFIGLWLMFVEWKATRSLRSVLVYGCVLVAIALVPTALVMAWYAWIGAFDAFFFANFMAIFARKPNPIGEALENLGVLVGVLAPLVALGLMSWRKRREAEPDLRTFLLLWLLASAFGVLVFGTWYEHYGLPVAVPAAACAAGFMAVHRKWTVVILLAAAIGGQVKVGLERINRGTPAEFARLIEAVGSGPGCLYVYSGHTMLYTLTERCRLTAYIFPSFLIRPRENGAMGVDQWTEVKRIIAQRPEVIVISPPYRVETLDIRAYVEEIVRRDYDAPEVVKLGNGEVKVYRLRR
ncbi:glycosyltransferase 87 family protein [Sphingomonas koreensis]|uniref:glycosyltransferase 87 family protein n=1 Tax=Sphingomonas koreensis TaxID=93064 RepID=UPI001F493E05|nr:glycosyltransferase 87 family protein [Sphingomonas koreensis]